MFKFNQIAIIGKPSYEGNTAQRVWNYNTTDDIENITADPLYFRDISKSFNPTDIILIIYKDGDGNKSIKYLQVLSIDLDSGAVETEEIIDTTILTYHKFEGVDYLLDYDIEVDDEDVTLKQINVKDLSLSSKTLPIVKESISESLVNEISTNNTDGTLHIAYNSADIHTGEITETILDLPVATDSLDGAFSKEDHTALTTTIQRVDNLEVGGLWRATYDTIEGLETADITGWSLNDFVHIRDDSDHDNNTTQYRLTDLEATGADRFTFDIVVDQDIVTATQTTLGVAMGSDSITVETDGSFSVKEEILQDIDTKITDVVSTSESIAVTDNNSISLVLADESLEEVEEEGLKVKISEDSDNLLTLAADGLKVSHELSPSYPDYTNRVQIFEEDTAEDEYEVLEDGFISGWVLSAGITIFSLAVNDIVIVKAGSSSGNYNLTNFNVNVRVGDIVKFVDWYNTAEDNGSEAYFVPLKA